MAGADRYAGAALNPREPEDDVLEFFEFVRARLEEARRSGDFAASIGGDDAPGREAVRLGAAVGQRYHQDQIVVSDGPIPRATASFMGLTGPTGVLPEHYTERVVEHRRDRDPALGEFFDLFNHRALSHFWRAWAKYRLPVAFAADDGELRDPFSRILKALAGLGVAGEAVPDEALLSMAGSFARRVRSAGALRRILIGIYHLPIEIVELQGRWLEIGEGEQTRLGAGGSDDGAFCQLGGDAVAGAAIWDVASRFRVRVGPLGIEEFRRFFEPGGRHAAMIDTIQRVVGANVDFAIQLVLQSSDVPLLQLDQESAPAALGQSTWLLAAVPSNDRDDSILASSIRASR